VAIAFLSLVLAGALTWQLKQLVRASERVDHSDQVLGETHELEKLILDLETGMRGYVVTGDKVFLAPYTNGRESALNQLDSLAALTQDEPFLQQHLGQVRARLHLWIAHSEKVISVVGRDANAQELIAEGQGRTLMSGMRQLLNEMVASEAKLRDQRSKLALQRGAITEAVAGGSLGVLGLLLGVSLFQRRRWEMALGASEERFHALTDQLTEYAVYLLDPSGEVASWNEGACRLYGYREEEALGRPVAALYTPEDANSALPARQREEAAARGQYVGQAWRMRKDGTRFWADQVLTALHDGDGALTGFAQVTRDLTERKQVEDRIRAAEAKLRGVLESAYDAILIANGRGEIEFANHKAQLALGYGQAELVGRPLEALVSAGDASGRDLLRERLRSVVSTHAGAELELQAARRDGREFPISLSLSSTGAAEGGAPVTAIFRDESEARHKARQQRLLAELGHELAKSLEYETVFRTIAELTVPALADWAVVDLCQADGEITRLAVAHGDPEKQALARRLHDRSLELPSGSDSVRRVIRTGQPILVEDQALERLRETTRDEESVQLLRQLGTRSYLMVPLQARGRILGVLTLGVSQRPFTAHDLRFAEEIAQRGSLVADNARLFQRATDEARLRQELVAIVSHDLRNPMHAIRLNAQVLERLVSRMDGVTPPPLERLRFIAGSIERAVDQGNRLITDLLDSAKIDSGTFSVARREVSLSGVFQTALETLQPIALEKGIALQLEATARVVPCDPERIAQALSNLIGNAIKFTPSGGRITVFAEESEREVRIGVRDTGRGVPQEALPHVFERYWQAEGAKRAGAGLGLSIVKGIVDAHGGRVWAQSTPGQGSTFWFSLPSFEGRSAEAEVEDAEAPSARASGAGPH
jgi:PAS domain S-box-containing protein